MGLVLLIAGGIWGLGYVMKVEQRARWLMIALLIVAVMMLNIVLPLGHPVRAATGGSAAAWMLLLGAGALVAVYRRWLAFLRTKIPDEAPSPDSNNRMSDTELERYARHIVLREIGGVGQSRLKSARVLVVGAGGLGAPVLMYLAAAGVGRIGVIDDDVVENANLQRQIIHDDQAIGQPKVASAADRMVAQNPYVDVRTYNRRLSDDIADELFADYDLIIDGSDNSDTRYLVNRAAVATGKPLISGALSQWEGQVSVFDPANDAPCYACVFPQAAAPGLAPSCAEAGVAGPLTGVVGSIMALEAVKVITEAGTPLRGQMLIYDGLYGETRSVALARRKTCTVCNS